MQHFGLVDTYADINSVDGRLIVNVTFKCNISDDLREYSLYTMLPDTHFNKHVLCRVLLIGLKAIFANNHAPYKSLEGVLELFKRTDLTYDKLMNGNYGGNSRLPRHSGESRVSAPCLLYYLFKKENALSREDVMRLTADTLKIDWIRASKTAGHVQLYTIFDAKDTFKEAYKREIRYLGSIIRQMQSIGKLPMPD